MRVEEWLAILHPIQCSEWSAKSGVEWEERHSILTPECGLELVESGGGLALEA